MEVSFSSSRLISATNPHTLSMSPRPLRSSGRPAPKRLALSRPPSASASASLSSSSSRSYSLGCGFVAAPFVSESVNADFGGMITRASSLNLRILSRGRRPARDVVAMVIPFVRENNKRRPPPCLASYLYSNRIVYLGMSLVPVVTELLLAEFMYLQRQNAEKPIYLYINSTGTMQGGKKLGYETEAFALYDAISYLKVPVFTLCVGNAWGEAALLLAAGSKGNRAALPSSTIMIRQPIERFVGRVSDVDIRRQRTEDVKAVLVDLYAKSIGKSREQIEQDIRHPKYFSPSEAVEYGIIDKVLYSERIL